MPIVYRRRRPDRPETLPRIENKIAQEGREIAYEGVEAAKELEYGYQERVNPSYDPAITVVVQWTPQFGMAYQQFVNNNMGNMNNYGGYGI